MRRRVILLALLLVGLAGNYMAATPPTTTNPNVVVIGSQPGGTRDGRTVTIGGGKPKTTVTVPRASSTAPAVSTTKPRRTPRRTKPPVTTLPGARSNSHSCFIQGKRLSCNGLDNHGQVSGAQLAPDALEVAVTDGVTCVRSVTREVWCWGYRMGGPNAESTSTPTRVAVPPSSKLYVGPGGMVCSVTITSGGLNQRGDDDPGELWCWGEGIDPAAGVTGRTWSATPTLIEKTRDFDKVAIGWRMLCTLTGEVRLTCYGALPDGTQSPRGTVLERNKYLRTVSITRVRQSYERVCVRYGGTSENCWG